MINGEIKFPKTYLLSTNVDDKMSLRDLIDIAGGFTKKAYIKSLLVTRYEIVDDIKQNEIIRVSKDSIDTFILQDEDKITVSSIPSWNDSKSVVINGEIKFPKTYLLSTNLNDKMSLRDLIDIAGGFTKKAFKNYFEVISYKIEDNKRVRVISQISYDDIQNYILKDEDEIKVFGIPNWNERKTVTLKGEVTFPGTYTISRSETIADVIKRAGGFTDEAFIEAAVFTRKSIREIEAKRMRESVSKLKQQVAYVAGSGREAGEVKVDMANMIQVVNTIEEEAKEFKGLGRITIKLSKSMEEFDTSRYNIRLEDKDTLIIPSFIDTISVFGEVLNQNTFVHDSDLYVKDYIQKAGGITQRANEESLYVVYPSGEVEKVSIDCWFGCYDEIAKGSTIMVPMHMKFTSNILFWKDASQVLYQLAITAASLNTIGVF